MHALGALSVIPSLSFGLRLGPSLLHGVNALVPATLAPMALPAAFANSGRTGNAATAGGALSTGCAPAPAPPEL
eukprot:13404116-Alexandrium_andersonii.AAC.1